MEEIIKSYTDIEQSKKLAEFLPIESADMHYARAYFEGNESDWFVGLGKPIKSDDIIPCWSLAALLELLNYPQLSKDKLGGEKVGWMVSVYPDNCRYDSRWYDNPVDTCMEMIIKLHESKML